MALVSLRKQQRLSFRAPCVTQGRLTLRVLKDIKQAFRCRAMLLESIDSNEHSIRFKVLEEVQLVSVVEHILANEATGSPQGLEPLPRRARALELLQLGAVYVGVPQKGLDFINWVRSLELPVAATAATVPSGHYVRLHPRPKRYPACYCSDWPSRVLYCDEEYVVVNKPAGLPCMRHESNALEELASCVSRALGLDDLEVCHRLDQWTTGVVVLSRTKDANKVFKRTLQDREAGLVKTYKALTYSPVPLGPLEHHMYDGPFNEGAPVLGGGNLRPRGPRLLSRTEHDRWKVCRLEVKECREHAGAMGWYEQRFSEGLQDAGCLSIRDLPRPATTDITITGNTQNPQKDQFLHQTQENEEKGGSGGKPCAVPQRLYESTVVLHTGRTHQIRAQLASIGCPLVGDVMYAPIAGYLVGASGVVEEPERVSQVEQLPMLDRHIGLHAWRLTWRGQTFTAPPEWGED